MEWSPHPDTQNTGITPPRGFAGMPATSGRPRAETETVDTAALRDLVRVLGLPDDKEATLIDAAEDEIDRLREECEKLFGLLTEEERVSRGLREENARLREEQRRDLAYVDRFRGNLIRADDENQRLRDALHEIWRAEHFGDPAHGLEDLKHIAYRALWGGA